MTRPVIAVIEWSSESGIAPAVFLADTVDAAQSAVARYLAPLAAEGSLSYTDKRWVQENPAPDYGDAAAVTDWLHRLQHKTTDAWLSIYTRSATDEPDSETYADVRS